MFTELFDDSESYDDWLADTRHGYLGVANEAKTHFRIHHSSCATVERVDRGRTLRLGADDPDDLCRWALTRGYSLNVLDVCQECCPGLQPTTNPLLLFGQPLVLVQSEQTVDGLHDHWDDEEGFRYQYPNNYVNRVRPGRWFVYYRGTRRETGRGEPEYFGVGKVGSISRDPAVPLESPRRQWRWYCTIEDYFAFETPISWKRLDGTHFERIAPNQWGVGVREIGATEFVDILTGGSMPRPKRRPSSITERRAILDAMAEYDVLGGDRFLEQYGYGRSTRYVLRHNGNDYESKAIVGVAFWHQFPNELHLQNTEFSGGQPVRTVLERLGFELTDLHPDTQAPSKVQDESDGDEAPQVLDLASAANEWERALSQELVTADATDVAALLAALDALGGRTHLTELAAAMSQNAAATARQLTLVQRTLGRDCLEWDRAEGWVSATVAELRSRFDIAGEVAQFVEASEAEVSPTKTPAAEAAETLHEIGQAGSPWTTRENRACVSAYFDILDSELAGRPVVKAHVRRDLRAGWLQARSDGSIEYKMQNVSAVMDELGCRWVKGYKPAGNFQSDLAEEVSRQLDRRGWQKYEAR